MAITDMSASSVADFGALASLKAAARNHESPALREAARQFESLFTRMLLKSMREASMGEGLGDSEETRFYQDMFDQQLAVQLSRGDGIGLASRLVEQLARSGLTGSGGAASTPVAQAPLETNEVVAATAAATTPQRVDFIARLRPDAERVAAQLGVTPDAVIAQAALETGWGRSIPAGADGNGNNLFGIKAGATWQGSRIDALTREFTAGSEQQLTQSFRTYASLSEGMGDYARLLGSSPRYAAALNTGADVKAFATALHRGGYATDPDYVQKLVDTAASVRELMRDAGLKSAQAPPIPAGNGAA